MWALSLIVMTVGLGTFTVTDKDGAGPDVTSFSNDADATTIDSTTTTVLGTTTNLNSATTTVSGSTQINLNSTDTNITTGAGTLDVTGATTNLIQRLQMWEAT